MPFSPISDRLYDRLRISFSVRTPCAADTARNIALTLSLAVLISSAGFAAPGRHQAPAATVSVDSKPVTVTLSADGQTRTLQTISATVGDLFKEIDLHLGKQDRCTLSPSAPIKDGQLIEVSRIRSEIVVERKPIPFPSRQKYVGSLPAGSKNVLQPGKDGEHGVKYVCYFKDDVMTAKEKVDSWTSPAHLQIEQIGTRGMTLASRGYFGGRRIIEMVATGYGPGGNGRWGMRTSSGLRPGFGVVAVDPRFIPLGTRLYIDGYGYAVAGDTGGAIKGNRIDLGHDTEREAAAEGRKKVRVLILD